MTLIECDSDFLALDGRETEWQQLSSSMAGVAASDSVKIGLRHLNLGYTGPLADGAR